MTQNRSLYEVLGVSAGATHDEIRSAYRRLLRTVHPDVGGNAALFSYVQTAWETLGDAEKRRLYDASRAEPRPSPESSPPPRRPYQRPDPQRLRRRHSRTPIWVGLTLLAAVGAAIAVPDSDSPPRGAALAALEAEQEQEAAAAAQVAAREAAALAERQRAARAAEAERVRRAQAEAQKQRVAAEAAKAAEAAAAVSVEQEYHQIQALFQRGWSRACRQIATRARDSGVLVSYDECMALVETTDVATLEDAEGFGEFMAEVAVAERYGP